MGQLWRLSRESPSTNIDQNFQVFYESSMNSPQLAQQFPVKQWGQHTAPSTKEADISTVHQSDKQSTCCQPKTSRCDIGKLCSHQGQTQLPYFPTNRCTTSPDVRNLFPCRSANFPTTFCLHHIALSSRPLTCIHSDTHNSRQNCRKRSCKLLFRFWGYRAVDTEPPSPLKRSKTCVSHLLVTTGKQNTKKSKWNAGSGWWK